MDKIPTICPYCGCGCGIYLHVDGNNITGVSPIRNHPVNKGSLCVKSWNCFEFIQHSDRLKYPLIKEKGSFRQATWNEALGLIASRFFKIKKSSGNDSIGILSSAKSSNEENYLMMKFARAVIGTNNIDQCARLCHSSTVGGLVDTFGSGAMTNSIDEIADARLLFVIGSDTTEKHPMIGMHMLDAVDKGALLIVADPRKTQLAELAHIHLRHCIGTDVALLNSIMNVMIREELVDISFVKRRTENFDAFKNTIMKYPPEGVAHITGVSPEDIRKVARLYATTRRAMLFYSMGITQHRTGVDNVCACSNISMLTAHIGLPNAGLNPLRGQNNVQGACDMGALPDLYSGYQKVIDPTTRKKFEKVWKVRLPSTPGLTLIEMFDSALKGNVRAMYIMGENPFLSNPDATRTINALRKLDFLVVQDIFLSETAEFADVVLPAATFAEKDGTFTNTERRVQKIRAAIRPVGESKPDWEIISALAREMNYDMKYRAAYEIMEEIALLTPIYRGILHHRLDNNFGLQWPCPDVLHPGTPFLHRKKFTKGLGTFIPVEYIPPAEVPDKKFPFILTTGRTYFHYHTGTMSRRTSTLNRECPECLMEINPDDANSLNIKHMDKLIVSSRRGKITVRGYVTDKTPQGVVFIPFHFKEAVVNLLTNPALDPSAKIPGYKACAVNIESIK
jgi:formate dehydrogenase alpha subunit